MNPNLPSIIGEQYRLQSFPLPKPIINYIIYAKIYPTAHQKLFKSCKYFFAKNPVIIIENIRLDKNKLYAVDHANVDRKLLPNNYPIWVTLLCEVHEENEQIIKEKLIDRLYHCSVKLLDLNNTILSMKHFIYLSKFATIKCYFHNLTLKDDNNHNMAIEEMINSVPCCKSFYCVFDEARYTQDTAEKLINLPRFSKLKFFCLEYAPEMFNPEILLKYLKDTKIRMSVSLYYSSTNLSNAFIARLSEINKEIISTENLDFYPPFIAYPGQGEEERIQLCKAISKFLMK